jgi:nucleotide-binding universal stress UspA family protein
MNTTKRIIVGTDGSDNSLAAVRWALHEATLRNTSVDLIHVWNYTPIIDPMGMGPPVMLDPHEEENTARRVLTEVVRKVDADRGTAKINEVVTQGPPAQTLLSAAKGAELVVVGRRGHGGFLGLLLGSVATQVVNHAPCPVVVVGSS